MQQQARRTLQERLTTPLPEIKERDDESESCCQSEKKFESQSEVFVTDINEGRREVCSDHVRKESNEFAPSPFANLPMTPQAERNVGSNLEPVVKKKRGRPRKTEVKVEDPETMRGKRRRKQVCSEVPGIANGWFNSEQQAKILPLMQNPSDLGKYDALTLVLAAAGIQFHSPLVVDMHKYLLTLGLL